MLTADAANAALFDATVLAATVGPGNPAGAAVRIDDWDASQTGGRGIESVLLVLFCRVDFFFT